MIPDGRAEVAELLARGDAVAFFREVFDQAQALSRRAWCTSRIQVDTEMRARGITLRERPSGGAVLIAVVENAQPQRIQVRQYAPAGAKATVDLTFVVGADGRLAVGAGEALDPAGVAQRAVDLLLATARPETPIEPERRQIIR